MRINQIRLRTKNGKVFDYLSIQDMWRKTKYSQETIRKAINDRVILDDGSIIYKIAPIIGYKYAKTFVFNSFGEATNKTRISESKIVKMIYLKEEYWGWRFDYER